MAVGMLSVRVVRSVPEWLKARMFVPTFAFASVIGEDAEVGGHVICVALTNSRSKAPFCNGEICSCQIYQGQLGWLTVDHLTNLNSICGPDSGCMKQAR